MGYPDIGAVIYKLSNNVIDMVKVFKWQDIGFQKKKDKNKESM